MVLSGGDGMKETFSWCKFHHSHFLLASNLPPLLLPFINIHRSSVYLHNKMPDLLLLLLQSVVLAQRVKQKRSAWIVAIKMEGRRKKMSTGIPLKKDALKTLATDTPCPCVSCGCPLSFPSCTPPTFGQQSWLDHSGLEQQAGNEEWQCHQDVEKRRAWSSVRPNGPVRGEGGTMWISVDRNKREIIEKYLNVPPFVSSSSPSWASAEHLDPLDDDVVSLTPSLAKFPICRMKVKGQKVKSFPGDSRNASADPP